MTILVLLGSMLVLAVMGLPLIFSLLAASVLAILTYRPSMPLEVVAQFFTGGLSHYTLLAVAFFFLVGELMNVGGITRRIVAFAGSIVGRIPGGLAHVNISSSMLFAGISGSAVADSAALGSVLIPSMKEKGYSAPFSAAVTACSSVIGPIIPPSIPMIVYAVLAEESIGRLFLAGIVPGVAVGLALMAYTYVVSRKRGYPRSERFSVREIATTGRHAILAIVAPILIVGGVLGGVFTATEAGVVAVVYCAIVGVVLLRETSWAHCWHATIRACYGTATVMVIVGSASVFAWVVADLQISQKVAEFIFTISEEPWAFLLMINIFLLIVGLFLDPLPALIITMPVFHPIAMELGVDPIHFGIIVVMNVAIGLCTPPVGFLIYMTSSMADCRPQAMIKESLPFLGVLLFVLGLVTYLPFLTLTLANLL